MIINTADEPVVMDFGLARSDDSSSIVPKDRTILGTRAYMPPEQYYLRATQRSSAIATKSIDGYSRRNQIVNVTNPEC